jgi:proteasome lid subunit RPN8/RPN11
MLHLTPEAAAAIARHAARTYPDECVGLLLGTLDDDQQTKRVAALYEAENTWQGQVSLAEGDDPQSRRDRFYLDPRDYLRAERAARAQGLDVIGCYHSHPDHPAEPSERDRIGFQATGGGRGFAFVIQRVLAAGAAEVRSWLLLDNGTTFEEEPIEQSADPTGASEPGV